MTPENEKRPPTLEEARAEIDFAIRNFERIAERLKRLLDPELRPGQAEQIRDEFDSDLDVTERFRHAVIGLDASAPLYDGVQHAILSATEACEQLEELL